MVEVPTGRGWVYGFGAEGLVGVGDVVFGALTFDVVGGAAPSVERNRLVGRCAEVAEVGGRVDGVGVDELVDAGVDGAFCVGESVEVVAVFRDELLVAVMLGACPCEGVVQTGEPVPRSPVWLVRMMRRRVAVLAVAPPALGFDRLEVAAAIGELFGDVVAPGGERVDLVGV